MDGVLAIWLCVPFERKALGPVAARRDLVRRRRMRAKLAALVPPELLHREPAHTLQETALELTAIERGIEGSSDVVQHTEREHAVLAGQRVDHHLGHRRTIGELEERTAGEGLAVVVDLRR